MKGDKKRKVTIEYYICPGCGLRFPIPRRRRREKNHIKTLWCPHCEDKKDFVKEDTYTISADSGTVSVGGENERL